MEINWTQHSGINSIPSSYNDYTNGSSSNEESIEIVFDCLQHETEPKIRAALIKEMFSPRPREIETILKSVWQA